MLTGPGAQGSQAAEGAQGCSTTAAWTPLEHGEPRHNPWQQRHPAALASNIVTAVRNTIFFIVRISRRNMPDLTPGDRRDNSTPRPVMCKRNPRIFLETLRCIFSAMRVFHTLH
jgi:hypothetical protein